MPRRRPVEQRQRMRRRTAAILEDLNGQGGPSPRLPLCTERRLIEAAYELAHEAVHALRGTRTDGLKPDVRAIAAAERAETALSEAREELGQDAERLQYLREERQRSGKTRPEPGPEPR